MTYLCASLQSDQGGNRRYGGHNVKTVPSIATFSRIPPRVAGPGVRDGKTAGEGLRTHSKETKAHRCQWHRMGCQWYRNMPVQACASIFFIPFTARQTTLFPFEKQ